MCGIVGYIGPRNAVDVLIAGLSHLEYRGYDSAGIAVAKNNVISIVKEVGRVDAIKPLATPLHQMNPQCGIGHTRWATHGVPNTVNAHPHSSKSITLVHNGIIENHDTLRQELSAMNIRCVSDTDTEVIVHILQTIYDRIHDPLLAIKELKTRIEGAYALAILFNDEPDTIYALRHGSPLLIGTNEDENFLASDMTPLLSYTKKYYLLEENEIAILRKKTVTFFESESLLPLEKEIHEANWDVEHTQKNGYDHFMLKEIHEQPDVFRNSVSNHVTNGHVTFADDGIERDFFEDIASVHIVGCGTALFAGVLGKHWLQKALQRPIYTHVASEFRYDPPLLEANDLVIVITQSGETADTLASLRIVKERAIRTLALVNVAGSSIAREADRVILTGAGIEIAVASTKAYTSQITILYLLGAYLADQKLDTFVTLPLHMENTLALGQHIEAIAHSYTNINDAFYIGRGMDYALSEEGSLKLKEISYVHSEAYPAGELKHGTISLIEPNTLTIALVLQEKTKDKMMSNIQEVRARGGKVLLITNTKTLDSSLADHIIQIDSIDDELTPFLGVIVIQLFAYYMSLQRGLDIDKPRNLAKSVTVE